MTTTDTHTHTQNWPTCADETREAAARLYTKRTTQAVKNTNKLSRFLRVAFYFFLRPFWRRGKICRRATFARHQINLRGNQLRLEEIRLSFACLFQTGLLIHTP